MVQTWVTRIKVRLQKVGRLKVTQNIALVASLLLISTGSAASSQQQQNPDQNSREIVVEGERPFEPRQIKKQARQITADRNLRDMPLARFEEPVCPAVIGLPLDLAGPIIIRVRSIAAAIGLDAADSSNCKPNIIIAFTGDGNADLKELAERDRSLLSGLTFWERKRLLREDGPTRAFAIVATKSNTGMGASGNSPVFQTTLSSRLTLSIRRDINVAVVLFDADPADGKTVTQLADFAAMRTFARTRPPEDDTAYPTILSLFEDGSAAPSALTEFDMAYLKAVYAGQANQSGMRKIKQVDNELKNSGS